MSEPNTEADQYGNVPDDFEIPSDVQSCAHCGAYALTGEPHPENENKIICSACRNDTCDCEDLHYAECHVCTERFHREGDWYRTPDDMLQKWICTDCGRKREKTMHLKTKDKEVKGHKMPF